MTEHGFLPAPPAAVVDEIAAKPAAVTTGLKDLRELPWTSIDNPESQDLDQVEATEKVDGGVRLYVAIADVVGFVTRGSATDKFAGQNTTSVYTGARIFPMLPERLSFDLTSLLAKQPRRAVIFETVVRNDGSVSGGKLYPALIENHAKLDYPSVSAWLDGKADAPANLADQPTLREQVQQQDQLSQVLAAARLRNGALDLDTAETRAVVDSHGEVTGFAAHRQDRAGRIIEELMIASNRTVARAIDLARFPSIRRVVKTPERWLKIVAYAAERGTTLPVTPSSIELSKFVIKMRDERPAEFGEISLSLVKLMGRGEYVEHRPGATEIGHFGLATDQYTHATAPNRRYVDLITQRLILAINRQETTPYRLDELAQIAAQCTKQEAEAQKVERRVQKSAAASLLSGRIGAQFEGIITGAGDKGTFVRVLGPTVEGKIVRGDSGLKVGDKVRVKLRDVSVEKGFIDFEIV